MVGKATICFIALDAASASKRRFLELRNVERLEHVIVRAALHRLDRGLRRAVGGHHDDDLLRVDLAQFLQRIETALLAHADVHHDQVGMMFPRHLDALVARLGALDVERFLLEQTAEGIMNVLLVVDDEDGLASIRGGRGFFGPFMGAGGSFGREGAWPRAPELIGR